jgi:hypothetical protein
MRCCGKERGKGYGIKRAIFIPIAIAAGVFIFGSAVMLLWNHLLPVLFGVGTITLWQAIGLLILAKILFGGFGGGHRHHKCHCHHHHGPWGHLKAEEKEKMKSEWNEKCAHGTQEKDSE